MQNNSDKLIKALNDSGLNQKKFAEALNISQGHLSEIVRGKKSPSSSLCELAQIRFGKPPDATESTFTGQGKQPYDSGVRLKEEESTAIIKTAKKEMETDDMWKDKYILQMELNQKLQTEISELKDCLLKKDHLSEKKLS